VKYTKILFSMWFLVVGAVVPFAAAASSSIFILVVEEDFDNVSVDVESAIANRGFVIDFHSNIGEMLDRTAKDVGSMSAVYKRAETWQFCSSILSRKMVEVNPVNIAYCPYIVFAYETTDNPGMVVVGYKKHGSEDNASNAILNEIDEHLESIVNEVAE